MNITNKKLFLIAIIFAVIASGLMYFYLAKIEEENSLEEPTQEVIVANVAIPPRTIINAEMLGVKEIDVKDTPPSAYLDINEIIGSIAKERIYKDEIIIRERIADEIYKKEHLAYSIPNGYRAVTLQYNPVMGVGGFIQPGDYVDVLGVFSGKASPTNEDIARITLKKVLVLAVGDSTYIDVGKENEAIQTITLAVTPKHAEKLAYTSELSSIRLMLRPVNDDSTPATSGTTKTNIFTP